MCFRLRLVDVMDFVGLVWVIIVFRYVNVFFVLLILKVVFVVFK